MEAGFAVGPRRDYTRDTRTRAGLDTNYFGAEMGELQRAVRSRPYPGEVGDADALERKFYRHQMTPSRWNSPSRAALRPSRAPKISPLCCPSAGAGIRISHGVAP